MVASLEFPFHIPGKAGHLAVDPRATCSACLKQVFLTALPAGVAANPRPLASSTSSAAGKGKDVSLSTCPAPGSLALLSLLMGPWTMGTQ